MSTPAAPVASSTDQQPLSEGARVIDTFIAPTKTFNDIRRSARWFVPWLLMAIFSYVFVAAVAQKVGWDQVAQNVMRQSPKQLDQIESLPQPKQDQAWSRIANFVKFSTYASPLWILVFGVVIATVLMGTFNFILGAEVTFGTSVAVVMYSWLPSIVKTILVAISLYAGASPEGFNIDNPLASNPGALVDVTAHPALYRLGTAFDIFTIWILILQGIGFSCVSKVKRSTAIGVVIGWFALYILVRTALAAISS